MVSQPVVKILYSLVNAGVALFVAFAVSLPQPTVAAIVTIVTAVTSLIAAVLTRPIVLSAITGAVQTGLVAAAAFGLTLSTDQLGAIVAALTLVLGMILHQNVSSILPLNSRPNAGPHA